jgi:hypothetical protein
VNVSSLYAKEKSWKDETALVSPQGTQAIVCRREGDPLDPDNKSKAFFEMRDEEVLTGTLAVAMDGSVLLIEEQREKGTIEVKHLVRKGPGNYTWLAVGRNGTPSEGMIYLLAGKDWLARFNLAWIMENQQRP